MRNPKISLQGELVIDHRASPGLTAEFYRAMGVDLPDIGEGKILETSTVTCHHCNNVIIKNPERTRERGYCPKCDGYICDSCTAATREADYIHIPFEKVVEVIQEMGSRGLAVPKTIVADGIHGRLPPPMLIILDDVK